MFDSSYPYHRGRVIKHNDDILIKTLVYSFKTVNKSFYIVNIEKYKNDVYILKFHLKPHSDSENKYKFIAHKANAKYKFDVPIVLNTCLNILLSIKKKNNLASFGFKGVAEDNEKEENTRRFRVYKLLTENKFSVHRFAHKISVENSTYLLLNKKNNIKNLDSKIEQMFNDYFFNPTN